MTYISQLLYVAVLCLTKLSIIIFIRYIALARWAAVSCRVLLYAVGLWVFLQLSLWHFSANCQIRGKLQRADVLIR